MKNFWIWITFFGVVNFGGLAIGSLFTAPGVASDWYQHLNHAPWTPPGWVFGAAWSTIMALFTVYLAFGIEQVSKPNLLLVLFGMSVVANVAWNPVFFWLHQTIFALGVLVDLTVNIALIGVVFRQRMGLKTLLILPYFVWLCIATSLNAYVVFMN